jgi:uncharacterized glyoxalase superfamily protein PhnB
MSTAHPFGQTPGLLTSPSPIGLRLLPALRYGDVAAAVDWLCRVFGMERQDVVIGADGSPIHAQLRSGNDFVLLMPPPRAE